MREEQNTSQHKPGKDKKHFPEDSQAPQSKNMEVHHHPHVERKNFKEYF